MADDVVQKAFARALAHRRSFRCKTLAGISGSGGRQAPRQVTWYSV